MNGKLTHALWGAAAGIALAASGLAAAGAADAAGTAPRALEPTASPVPVTAYVANSGSDTVTPIDTATNTALPAITVGHDPVAVAITPDGKTALACLLLSGLRIL